MSEIQKEIKQVSGYATSDDLLAAIPDNPDKTESSKDSAGGASPKQRKPRAKKTAPPVVAPDPFANDPRYQEACAEMAAFGGKGFIERGFDSGARLLEDDSFKLNDAERRQWDNFFYVLSKKPMFDVGKPLFLALFFLITLLSQLGWRVLERSDSPFIQELFKSKEKENEDGIQPTKPN
jgi:hypothetical protein